MPADDPDPICRRCDRPVRVNRDNYETFEQMHFVCFHFEFEHDVDPDDDCGVAGCHSAPAAAHKDRLLAAVRELIEDWSAGPPASWEHHSLAGYLVALAGWLQDCEDYYADRGTWLPWNSWEVVETAMRAATTYGARPA